ncbi:MAG: hypothetical protein NC041_08215 [Bacteroides sp.]|nr:hypothetical protein [Prevotella sp.]MCM1408332.1 glycoside hydrolase family 3 protein [Treponema brennaborense]MCM1470436.1 hypothetical protein [Bacteroides sp.]
MTARKLLLIFAALFAVSNNAAFSNAAENHKYNFDLSRTAGKSGEQFRKNIAASVRESYCARLARLYAESLPLEQKISQMLLVSADGTRKFMPAPDFKKGYFPGGFILFSRNIADSPQEIIGYTDSILKAFETGPLPLLAVDHEGGFVNRLRGVTSPLPSAEQIPQLFSPADAYALYFCTGMQLKALGFSVNLAPIAEVKTADNADFLASRSYGTMDAVLSYGAQAVRAYANAGILPVLKHFPGNTNDDPHAGLPRLNVSENELHELFVRPFKELFAAGNSAVLLSHVVVPCIDDVSSCLSEKMIASVLRKSACFEGLVFSDDICMSALSAGEDSPKKLFVKAILAGVDIIMSSDPYYADIVRYAADIASEMPELKNRIDNAVFRICYQKALLGLLPETAPNESTAERLAVFADACEKASAVQLRSNNYTE